MVWCSVQRVCWVEVGYGVACGGFAGSRLGYGVVCRGFAGLCSGSGVRGFAAAGVV